MTESASVADIEKGERSKRIAAAPAEIYAMVSDVTRTGEWAAECVRCDWLGGATEAVIGARFAGHNRLGEREWSMVAVVDEADPDRGFSFHTESQAREPVTRWRYTLEPDGAGTLVTESFERLVDPGLTERHFEEKQFGGRVKHNLENIEASLTRLAQIVEEN